MSGASWAAETADDSVFTFAHVNKKIDAFTRLREAYDAVHQDAAVKQLLEGSNSDVNSLSMTQFVSDPELETTKFQQFFKGVEVIGAKVFRHKGKDFSQVKSNIFAFDMDIKPKLSLEDAVSVARSVFSADQGLSGVPVLKILPSMDEKTARLIYWVTFAPKGFEPGRDILVDANSGDVISEMSHEIEIAPVDVFTTMQNGQDISGCQDLDSKGRPNGLNPSACLQVVDNGGVSAMADTSARNAASNSMAVLTYYQTHHGRNSYDDRGSASTSVVHVGKKFDNAFWSSDINVMAYGDGDGQQFGDFTSALDVAGHEMTHGVTAQTAKLMYEDESGALNEAFSDFFGKMIANDGDWAIGKKLFLDSNSRGIRDLANPGILTVCAQRDTMGKCKKSLPYPAKMAQKFPKQASCGPQNDNCWVHINSTIPSHAMYLVSQAITKAKAERLFFLVLTHYMTETSTFKTFGRASTQACGTLFDGATCNQVRSVFAQVGLL